MKPESQQLQELDIDIQKFKPSLVFQTFEGIKKIRCSIRNKYLVIQPEELIRQLWILFLIEECKVSAKLMRVEKQITVFGKRRRFDLILYNNNHQPFVLLEFKSFQIKLTNSTFEQISLYNQELKIPKLIISNGIKHHAASIDFRNSSYKMEYTIEDILNEK